MPRKVKVRLTTVETAIVTLDSDGCIQDVHDVLETDYSESEIINELEVIAE